MKSSRSFIKEEDQTKKICGSDSKAAKFQSCLDVRFIVEIVPIALDIIALINSAPTSVISEKKRGEMLDFMIPKSVLVNADKRKFMSIRIDRREPDNA